MNVNTIQIQIQYNTIQTHTYPKSEFTGLPVPRDSYSGKMVSTIRVCLGKGHRYITVERQIVKQYLQG